MTEPSTALTHVPEAAIAAALAFAEQAKQLVVTNAESYAGALRTLQELRTIQKSLEEQRTERTKPLLAEKRAIDDEYKPAQKLIEQANAHLVKATNAWRAEQDRIRQEAERKALEQAERERNRALAKVEEYREKGNEGKAWEWEQKAMAVPVVVSAPQVPDIDGVSFRRLWRFEIVDQKKLPQEYLIPDVERIEKAVQALKELAEETIPGIRVWYEDIPVTRRI